MGDIKDFFFGETEQLQPEDIREPWAVAQQERLGGAAMPGALDLLGRAGGRYPGQLTAPFGELERWGLGGLGDYLSSPLASQSSLFQGARGELGKTFGGEYDPFEGEYYRAYRSNLKRELEEAKDRLAAKTSSRDQYFGGGRIQATGELEETAMGQLSQVLGQLYERERERRQRAISPAMQMSMFETTEPLGRIETALSPQMGGMPRGLEQAGYDRQYSEYIRQLTSLGIPLQVASNMALYSPPVSYPLYSSTPGLFGGPSGIGYAPGGGVGDAQRIQGVLAGLAKFGQSTGLY